MAEIINVNDITNGSISNGEWAGTGIFDKLIDAVNNNLAIQLESGRLTNSEFGSVYSNIIPAVLNSSIDFVLKKRLTEIQLDGSLIDNDTKEYTKDTLLIDEHNKNLKAIDSSNKEIEIKSKQLDGLQIDNDTKEYTKDTLLVDEHNKNLKAIDSSNKEIEIKSKQLETEYINMIIKDKEAVKIGMDKAFANNNANLKDVYTPIYKEVI